MVGIDDPPAVAAVAENASAESQTSTAAAAAEATAATAASPRQVFLTPTGAVVVGFPAAQAYSKVYQGRVTADQKVGFLARMAQMSLETRTAEYLMLVAAINLCVGGCVT